MRKPRKNRGDSKISRAFSTKPSVPSCIFNTKLSSYETLVKFLKESYGLRVQEISILLNKKKQSVWRAYKQATKKFKQSFEVTTLYYPIPIKIFTDSKLTILQTLVIFLKDHYQLTYSEIAALLMRDDRTIWTVYYKAKK